MDGLHLTNNNIIIGKQDQWTHEWLHKTQQDDERIESLLKMVKIIINGDTGVSLTQTETDTQFDMTTEPMDCASLTYITGKGLTNYFQVAIQVLGAQL